MSQRLRSFYLISMIFLLSLNDVSAKELSKSSNKKSIIIVTEQLPPFNYIDRRDGQMKGICLELIQILLNDLGRNETIEFYPWARAYKLANEKPNVLIFSMARNKDRENQFHWIGKLIVADTYFYRKKKDVVVPVSNLEEAKKYTTIGVRKDVATQYLLNNNFQENENLFFASSYEQMIKMLDYGRADFGVGNDLSFYFNVKTLGLSEQEFERAKKIEALSLPLYLAFSKSTSQELIEEFTHALASLKQKAVYREIIEKYSE